MAKTEEEPEVVEGEAEEEVEPDPETTHELALAIREERAAAVQPQTTLPTPREWEATLAVARQIAATEFVPESYRGRPESVVAAILTGREMGIGPMQALRDIHMIDGRPAFSAQLMLSKMRAGGIVVLESSATSERAWIKARRADTGEVGEFEFTKEDADTARLSQKKNWQTWPSDMMWARAVGRMARRFGSDLLGGMVYSKEELEDWDEGVEGYGSIGSGYDASTFDVGRDLLPGAVQGSSKEAVDRLQAIFDGLNDRVDWKATIGEATRERFKKDRPDFSDEERAEWWVRLRNTAVKLEEIASGDLGASPQDVQEAFAFGFSLPEAEKVAIVMLESEENDDSAAPELSEHDKQIGFGEDEPAE